MIRASYQLDISSGSDEEPLGNIIFSNTVSTVVIENTYVDSWFLCMIQSLKGLKSGDVKSLEILEEPYSIDISMDGTEIVLSYMGESLKGEYDEFWQELERSAYAFVSQVISVGWGDNNETIKNLTGELKRLGCQIKNGVGVNLP